MAACTRRQYGVHLFLGAVTAAALSSTSIIDNSFVAFGAGVGAVVLVKKAGSTPMRL